jgi:predicted ATP-dependent serine protease
VVTGPRKRTGVVSAAEMHSAGSASAYPPPFAVWNIPVPHAILVFGPAGGGKSTLATMMALAAAARTDVLYIAAEEGIGETVAQRLERCATSDLAKRRLRISDARSAAEIAEDIENTKPAIVVLDSLSELRLQPEAVLELVLGRSWIGVSHVNARGAVRGGQEFPHAVDVTIRVEDGTAVPLKNRFGGHAPISVYSKERVG